MKYCNLCGKQLGIFKLKHVHKTSNNKRETWCHDCYIKHNNEIMEERKRELNELQKADEQLKLEKKFVTKVIKAIDKYCVFTIGVFTKGVHVIGVEVRDYTSKDGVFTINILGNYCYGRHDYRYTVENMMKHKKSGFESYLGNIIVNLSKEKQTYDYEKINVIFWGEQYDMYGHGTWVRYASFTLITSTLKKMNLANLKNYQIIDVFEHHIGNFPNGLD